MQLESETRVQNAATLAHPEKPSPSFPPLEEVTRPTVPTEQAAHYLDRQPQTMRIWACKENGPIRPLRIHGRLHWSVSELRRLLGVDK